MARKFIRKIQRIGSHSYYVNLPKEIINLFGWKERQKLVIRFGGRKHELHIRDFVPKKKRL